MGFSAIPPRLDSTAAVIAAIDNWAPHADAAIMHVSPPWAAMLGGATPDSAVRTVELPLANYYRTKGLAIVFTVDATDGLNRAAEAPELVSAGRSITDTMVQRLYRDWVFAVATRIRPDYLGLAAEIAQDLADFPFVEALGLSSYPYLGGFADPESIPLDYYSRIPQGTTLPVLVVEGGWPSVSVGGVMSSPAEEARYITRQAQLLDSARARGLFQLTFYDLDLSGFPPQPPGSILPLFTHLGLADSAMNAKPALAPWDSAFRRPYRTP